MIPIIILIVLILDYLFHENNKLKADYLLEIFFHSFNKKSTITFIKIMFLFLCWILIAITINYILSTYLYNIIKLVVWILLSFICIKPEIIIYKYEKYSILIFKKEVHDHKNKLNEFIIKYSSLCNIERYTNIIDELQSTLLWINFRFYLVPLFWLIIGQNYGLVLLLSYTFLRSYQIWLKQQVRIKRKQFFCINKTLNFLDWIPSRLVSLFYVLLGNDEYTLPIWLNSLWNIYSDQYNLLIKIAKISLKIKNFEIKTELKSVVDLTKKVNLTILITIILFTIYNPI